MKEHSLDEMHAFIPEPHYPCADEGCAEERSYPANELVFCFPSRESGASLGFYCENCFDAITDPNYDKLDYPEHTLADVLAEQGSRDA